MTWIRSEPGGIGRALVHVGPSVVVSAMRGLGVYGVSTSKPVLVRLDDAGLRRWCEGEGIEAPTADDLAWVQA